MTGFLYGTATALITPFTKDGVNLAVFRQMIERQIRGGVSSLVVLGTTGEPTTMTESEKIQVIKCAVKAASGRVKVIVGTGSNSTEKAVKMSRLAEKLGANGILAVTPYYNKCTQRGLYEYYSAIANAVKIPVICYNVPARTGVNILPETMARLADLPNIAGIKEASGNMAQVMETMRLIRDKCDLYSGEDALNLPILAAGGTAVISVVSNLAPEKVCALSNAALRGDLTTANKLSDELLPLIKACFTEVNPIPVKEGMNLLGFDAGIPRPPLTELESQHFDVLKQEMLACGLEVKV